MGWCTLKPTFIVLFLPIALVSLLATAQTSDSPQPPLKPPCHWLEPPTPSPVATYVLGAAPAYGGFQIRIYLPNLCDPCKYSLDDHSSHDDPLGEQMKELPRSVYETTDLGEDWKIAPGADLYSDIPPASTDEFLPFEFRAPSDPKVRYRLTSRGFSRSDKAGSTWVDPKFLLAAEWNEKEWYPRFSLEAISPSDPLTVFATVALIPSESRTTRVRTLGLYRSKDGGDSWQPFAKEISGLAFDRFMPAFSAAFAISSSNPSVMYGFAHGDIVRTADGGATWSYLHVADTLGARIKPTDERTPKISEPENGRFRIRTRMFRDIS
jgi:hypothetical protein